MQRSALPLVWLVCLPLTLTACSIGPKYQRQQHCISRLQRASTSLFQELEGWKVAAAQRCHSPWAMVDDLSGSQLNALEAQVDVSIRPWLLLKAQLRGARAAISVARAASSDRHGCLRLGCASVPELILILRPCPAGGRSPWGCSYRGKR